MRQQLGHHPIPLPHERILGGATFGVPQPLVTEIDSTHIGLLLFLRFLTSPLSLPPLELLHLPHLLLVELALQPHRLRTQRRHPLPLRLPLTPLMKLPLLFLNSSGGGGSLLVLQLLLHRLPRLLRPLALGLLQEREARGGHGD